MKEKYYEERFPLYHEMNRGSGEVLINTGNDIVNVNPLDAEALINQNNNLVEMVKKLGDALEAVDPEKFKEIWYG